MKHVDQLIFLLHSVRLTETSQDLKRINDLGKFTGVYL